MRVLDIQRRGQQIGRLRIGQQVATEKGGMRPVRLDTFRFTTGSSATAKEIARLYGGEVREWAGEYEVITGKSEIGVTVPPRDEVISQSYEMWNKGGCLRRCDSQREVISGGPCLCPHAADPDDPDEVARAALERADLARKNPPQACKLVTRISVMIPDLPGLGVFRLDTGSYYAAVEIGDAADLMQMARDRGVFLPAILRIEQRQRVADGQTKKYPVPVLEVLATFRDIASGALEAGGVAAQLPPAPGEHRLALTSGKQAPATGAQPAPEPEKPQPRRRSPQAKRRDANTHQRIADDAANATTRQDVEALAAEAKEAGVIDDHVRTSAPGEPEVYESLRDYLGDLWKKLAADGGEQ